MDLKEQRGKLTDWKVSYGFILYLGRKVFVHKNNCVPGFRAEIGAQVMFDFALCPDPKRPPQAVNVRVTKTVAQQQAEEDTRRELLRLSNLGGV
jgi:hypothetical protein